MDPIFLFIYGGIGWRVDAKTITSDEPSLSRGVGEIEPATDIPSRRNGWLLRQVLRLQKSLKRHSEFDGLRSPFEDGFRHRFLVHHGGMLVSYARGGH